MRKTFVAAAALALVAVACTNPATEQHTGAAAGTGSVVGGDRRAGAEIYKANCATCHGPTGAEGGTLGPSLRHESSRLDYGAAVSWIDDPAPPMPHLYPKVLTQNEVRDVAAYVESL